MGTRGWFVFRHKGVYYRVYNHFDSYFDGLGLLLVNQLIAGGKEFLNAIRALLDLGIVDGAYLKPPADPKLAKEWESFLKMLTDGCIASWFRGERELIDHSDEILVGDGLCIEYIYVIDMDQEIFFAFQEGTNSILGYPFATLHPSFMTEWASEGYIPSEGGVFMQAFPLPKRSLDILLESFESHGYIANPEPVSSGKHAFVFEASHIDSSSGACTDERVFIKTFPYVAPRSMFGWSPSEFRRPMAIAPMLMASPHPNVVGVIKTARCGSNFPTIFLEPYDNDLGGIFTAALKSTHTKKSLVSMVCKVLADVAQGVIFLASKGVVHHDIKPGNILVRLNPDVKGAICDFESYGIPFTSGAHPDWWPFDQETEKARDERWFENWSPCKWTNRYAHPQRAKANPWHLDSYSLSFVAEEYLNICFCNSQSGDKNDDGDDADSKDDGPLQEKVASLRDEVVKILRNEPESVEGVCASLEMASGRLREFASGLN